MFTNLIASALPAIAPFAPILAAGNKWKTSAAWGIVLFCVVLGVLATVNPVKREKEIKGRRE